MTGGVFALFTKWLAQFHVFSSVVAVVCSNQSAADLPTRQRHTTVGTTKTPQYGAHWVCDRGFLWLGRKWEWIDLNIQSEENGSIF